jgi:Holliday junction resolvase
METHGRVRRRASHEPKRTGPPRSGGVHRSWRWCERCQLHIDTAVGHAFERHEQETLMGKMQREKGKAFERKIAADLRSRWPTAVIRRASQAERADNPDVFCESGPTVLRRLWLELQDARKPNPLGKLEQAERDVLCWATQRDRGAREFEGYRFPAVVWHKLAERTVWVTTRLWILDRLRGTSGACTLPESVVTLDWPTFLDMVQAAGGDA